jgi:carbonic anhydrase
MQPGDIFVHRNVANVVNHIDLSLTSVVEYAVDHVGVKHIFIVGHTACGGCTAALSNKKIAAIDVWLQPLCEIRAAHWA